MPRAADLDVRRDGWFDWGLLDAPEAPSGAPSGRVIGISGATRSGKSSLAAALRERLGDDAVVVSQDAVFMMDAIEANGGDWDRPDVLDHDRLRAGVLKAASLFDTVIVEGFLLFHDPQLVALLSGPRVWLEASRATVYERRMATKPVSEAYFDRLWAAHQAYEASAVAAVEGVVRVAEGESVASAVGLVAGLLEDPVHLPGQDPVRDPAERSQT